MALSEANPYMVTASQALPSQGLATVLFQQQHKQMESQNRSFSFAGDSPMNNETDGTWRAMPNAQEKHTHISQENVKPV